MSRDEQDINRSNLADVAPSRRAFIGRQRVGLVQPGTGAAETAEGEPIPGNGVTLGDLTTPGPRPFVYQTALNFTVDVGLNPSPLQNATFPCDAIIIGVPNGGTTVNFGYGSGITTATGIPIAANQPIEFFVDNVREQWELQRALEALIAVTSGGVLPKYRAPRVVLDLNKYFLVTTVASQPVACMALYIPEGQ